MKKTKIGNLESQINHYEIRIEVLTSQRDDLEKAVKDLRIFNNDYANEIIRLQKEMIQLHKERIEYWEKAEKMQEERHDLKMMLMKYENYKGKPERNVMNLTIFLKNHEVFLQFTELFNKYDKGIKTKFVVMYEDNGKVALIFQKDNRPDYQNIVDAARMIAEGLNFLAETDKTPKKKPTTAPMPLDNEELSDTEGLTKVFLNLKT